MLASSGTVSADRQGWCWECKWDGWRAVVYIDAGGAPRVRTRAGRQVADALPELAGLVDAVDGRRVILDGELVACPHSRPDFYVLAAVVAAEMTFLLPSESVVASLPPQPFVSARHSHTCRL